MWREGRPGLGRGAVEDSADFVVVGTGAGGATAARVLTEAGHSVIMVEEGPDLTSSERPPELLRALTSGMRNMATTATRGKVPMPLLMGRCVGGSTAVNSGIIWRLPPDVIEHWSHRYGLGELVEPRALDEVFERIERDLEVEPSSDETLGGNGELLAKAARAFGLPGKPTARNARRCRGSARCLQGCPEKARQSMDVSYVPWSRARGARLYSGARVEQIETRAGRAVAVTGRMITAKSRQRFRLVARRAVIVSAGAIFTPVLLRRSGVLGRTGERFQAHPGAAVIGRFPHRVGMSVGATQSYEIPMRDRGYKIESLSVPPEMLAARLPGAGAEWQERLAHLDTYAQWVVQVRMGALGRVRPGLGGSARVRYEPLPSDLEKIREAIALLCRLMFAAGAVEVYPGLAHVPEVLRDASEVRLIEEAPLERASVHLVASHLFGTACASAHDGESVVSERLETHAVRGLYVMDASVFPTNLGVNPQHSIMAIVHRAASWLANEERRAERLSA